MRVFRMLATAMTVLGAATVIAAPSATAGTVQNGYSCAAGLWGWQERYTVTVNVPATARQGDTITVTGSTRGTTARSGARAAGVFTGSMLLMNGGNRDSVDIVGMANPEARDGDPYSLVGGSGQITLDEVGVITFHPQSFASGVASDPRYGWVCFDPDGVSPTVASIQVLPR